jgi:hypothetical protein
MQQWQREQEALDRLGFSSAVGSADRQKAVDVVIDLMREIERLKQKVVSNGNP